MLTGTPLFPESASTMAGRVDALYFFLLAISVFFSLLIAGLIVFYAVKYRRRTPNAVGENLHGAMMLEVAWTVIPFLLTMVIFVWSAGIYFAMSRPPDETLNIYVVGKQWMWKFQHLDGQREINELHVPVGRAVKLIMTSEDVIHDVFVPAFRVKADVLPGRYTNLWFQPTKPGRYHLFCAEYCGTNHSAMGGWVYVMEPVEFQQWLSQAGTGASMAEQGERLFVQYHCAGCHRGSQTVHAPRLEGVYGRPVPVQQGKEVRFTLADYRYIRDSILRPKSEVVAGYEPVMPSFEGQITESDLLKLIAYIKSIGAKEATQ
ncbi:MAG: cytochrome c oxidase subunit II [Isosphaeraceae bacterium]